MSEGTENQDTHEASRNQKLLERAREAYFQGKISQAAYLWEKVLDSHPENEEAQACRGYVRRNSIALRAVALGKDIKVPPPPSFLEPSNHPKVQGGGPKRHSSTEDMEWSDLGFEDPSEPESGGTALEESTGGQGDTGGFGFSAEAASGLQRAARDTSRITTRFKPEEVSGKELVEGLQPATEMGEPDPDGVGDGGLAEEGAPERGGAREPKPSTTLSGMPTSRLMPKDLFDPDAAQFGAPARSAEADLPPPDTASPVSPLMPAQLEGSEESAIPDVETEPAATDTSEPEAQPADSEDLEVKPADWRSEALLDPDKGLRQAQELFERGHHTDSLEICELLADALPDNETRKELMERNLEILESLYLEKLGDTDAVPRVELAQGNLQDIQMDHKTAFLLTRIDGMLTIEEVLDIAGMSRFEAAKTLVQALEEGIIRID